MSSSKSKSKKIGQFRTLNSAFKMFQIMQNYLILSATFYFLMFLMLHKMPCTIIYCIRSRSINNLKVKVKVIFEIYLEPGGFLL